MQARIYWGRRKDMRRPSARTPPKFFQTCRAYLPQRETFWQEYRMTEARQPEKDLKSAISGSLTE
jgi:hypothetical protein